MRRTKDGHYAPSWQEMAEAAEARRAKDKLIPVAGALFDGERFALPAWRQLEAEAAGIRLAFMADDRTREMFEQFYRPGKHAKALGTIVPPPAEAFTATNIQHFQYLPSVERIKAAAVELGVKMFGFRKSPAMAFAGQYMGQGSTPEQLVTDEERDALGAVIRAEQSHMLYHKAMWRAHGKRVVVLDPTTYTLLANTDLPKFPASLLASPWPAFYIQLPPRMFEFEVGNVREGVIDRRFAEGVCVALDHAEPGDGETDTRVRELAFMVMGEDEGEGADGRNCAFASIRFGGDAVLSDFANMLDVLPPDVIAGSPYASRDSVETLAVKGSEALGGTIANMYGRAGDKVGYASRDFVGAEALGTHIPRVIIGLMLYLASEHPDVVPVAPAPRRNFAEIRSDKQRAAALASQAEKLRKATKLPVLLVGSRVKDAAEQLERDAVDASIDSGKKWTLDHELWVRGHWKQQAHGTGRKLRRPLWIRPYRKGPDMADALARAARVQKARMNPERVR